MKKIIIGARGSKLSLAYVDKVKYTILQKNQNLNEKDIIVQTIKTSGEIFHTKKYRYCHSFFERHGITRKY